MIPVRRTWFARLGDTFETGGLMLWILVLIVAMVFLVSISISAYKKNQELDRTVADLERQLREQEGRNESLRREKQALEQDPVYIERILRKDLRMIRDGERVVRQD